MSSRNAWRESPPTPPQLPKEDAPSDNLAQTAQSAYPATRKLDIKKL